MRSSYKLAISLSFLFLPVICATGQYGGWAYAGYKYNKASIAPFTTGLSANIYTINPVVYDAHLAEWISVTFQSNNPRTPYYWVQLGYWKSPSYGLHYYYEWWDQNGYSGPQFLGYGPGPGTTHLYFVQKTGVTFTTWYYYIDYYLIASKYLSLPSPYAVDLRAEAEVSYTTNSPPKTSITGTHFSYLEYNYGGSWSLWDQHSVVLDPPYHIIEVSDYEFYAYGP
jgi:hypothetical protein